MDFNQHVGIFFTTPEGVILHLCPLEKGEKYGDFINYPHSHDEVWQKHYASEFDGKAFDFFPRGRIIFHKPSGMYHAYHDGCTGAIAMILSNYYDHTKFVGKRDIHYKCRWCNPEYIDENSIPTYHGWVPDRCCELRDTNGKLTTPAQLVFRNLVFDA